MFKSESLWGALSREIAAAVERAAKSVVAVQGRPRMSATGIVWNQRTVMTAAHCVAHLRDLQVSLPGGEAAQARLVGLDPGTDLAALRIEHPVEPATLSATADLAPGRWVVAVARLASARIAASAGIISEVGASWRTWRGGLIDQAIRLDGGLGPGFSGAPLIDESAGVLGLCTSGLARGRAIVIPSSTVDRVFRELDANGRVSRAYVGLAMQGARLSSALAQTLALQSPYGALIASVQPQGPGEQAGIMVGDVLVALGGKPVADAGDVQDVLVQTRAGDTVNAVLIRGSERIERAVLTTERPAPRAAC